MARLHDALVADRLGPNAGLMPEFRGLYPSRVVRLLDRLRADPAGKAKVDSILHATLADTLKALSAAYGADMTKWRWGDTHRAALTSQLLGRIPLLGSLFDIGLPASGGDETVNRGGYRPGDYVHFPDIHGPGYRGVFDLANLDASRFVIATGESGNPLSPWYGNLAERWRNGDAVTLAGTAAQVAATGLGEVRFTP
jgi:penicillin amidase